MDFFTVTEKVVKNQFHLSLNFNCDKSKDLMTRGRNFYAIWNPETNMWSLDEYDVYKLVDAELQKVKPSIRDADSVIYHTMKSFDSGNMLKYKKLVQSMSDNYKELNQKVLFADAKIRRDDYASFKLSYEMKPGDISAYDELMSTIYDPLEREKLEWAIGSIVSGDSKKIQKFIVLYGEGGSGKSTFLNILHNLFQDYCCFFDAKALVSANSQFGTEAFRKNPLVAIQHDGDLSKIEDNTKLNSIISHEDMIVNEKYKSTYSTKMNCFLFMGSNKPVKITDAKSGIIRRLIDVKPSGRRLPPSKYDKVMNQINFELGAIAEHCYNVYMKLGKKYYDKYTSKDMMLETNIFYNFVQENFFLFQEQNGTSLNQAYTLYNDYIDSSGNAFKLPKHIFREELKVYFSKFKSFGKENGKCVRDYYSDFISEKVDGINYKEAEPKEEVSDFISKDSIFDGIAASYPAQYANSDGTPSLRWSEVKTTLADIDTSKLHYVKVPTNHIVIDFDLKDSDGNKSKTKNLEAMSSWQPSYAEFSKSGAGVHLHYIYNGDVDALAPIFTEGIEIKVFKGNSSLRRQFTYSNGQPITELLSGLPLKEKKMITETTIKSERGLRRMVERNLNKEIHSATKPSIDFIYKLLEDAYNGEMKYDLTDMQNKILTFAAQSSNNSEYCINIVNKMKFKSKVESPSNDISDSELVFYDVEVFPNLFIVCYKAEGENKQTVKMINPTSLSMEELFKLKLVGFNCRRYDNHILYARFLGYNNERLYELSQKIINDHGGMFGEAYNISYTDVYDFSNTKQSLKKWEIELGLNHLELGYKWDQVIPEDKWDEVASYCINDVIATEAVFHHLKMDWLARQIIADLAGGSVNDTTNTLTTKYIFGDVKHPKLIYTDLATGIAS